MIQHSDLKTKFPELFLALVELDFVHDFAMRADGMLYCRAYPSLLFELYEVDITAIPCYSHRATLFLIKTKGIIIKGTFIDYHEI